MNEYCFNYMVENCRTFLAIFITAKGSDIDEALNNAKKYIQEQNPKSRIKVFPEDYPDMKGKQFQTREIPEEWYSK